MNNALLKRIERNAERRAEKQRSDADRKRHDRVKKKEREQIKALFAYYQEYRQEKVEAAKGVPKILGRDVKTVAKHLALTEAPATIGLAEHLTYRSQHQTNAGSQQPADKVPGPLADDHLEQPAVQEAKATTGTEQLFNRTKEKSDRLIAKAKEEHLAEMGLLLKKWKSELGRAHIDGGWLRHLPNNFLGAENKQLFPLVLDHCPSVSEKYLPFKNIRECYRKKWEALVTEIGLMAPGSNEWFILTAAECSILVALGEPYARYTQGTDGLQIIALGLGPMKIADGSAGNLGDRGSHRELVERCSKSESVKEILKVIKTFRSLQEDLIRAVGLCLLSREYVTSRRKCGCCPT